MTASTEMSSARLSDADVTVLAVRCIRIKAGYEYGSFYIRTGTNGRDKGHWAELTINSSFGNVGYTWGSMGCEAHRFFDSDDKHYLMNKLFGEHAYVFDFDSTIAELKRSVLRERRGRDSDKHEAKERWDAIGSLEETRDQGFFYHQFLTNRVLSEWYEPTEIPCCTILNQSAEGLWKHLWPHFVTALKEQHAKETA